MSLVGMVITSISFAFNSVQNNQCREINSLEENHGDQCMQNSHSSMLDRLRRKWNWLGLEVTKHVNSIAKQALQWTLQGHGRRR